jgi:hypothetical protein
VLRQPQLGHLHPGQSGLRGDADLQQVGRDPVQRGGLDLDLPGRLILEQAQATGGQRQGRRLQEGEHDHEDQDNVKQEVRLFHLFGQRDGGQHDGHRAAQSGPGQEELLANGQSKPDRRREHRSGSSNQS